MDCTCDPAGEARLWLPYHSYLFRTSAYELRSGIATGYQFAPLLQSHLVGIDLSGAMEHGHVVEYPYRLDTEGVWE